MGDPPPWIWHKAVSQASKFFDVWKSRNGGHQQQRSSVASPEDTSGKWSAAASRGPSDFLDFLNWRTEQDQREHSSTFTSRGASPDWGHKSTSEASREFSKFVKKHSSSDSRRRSTVASDSSTVEKAKWHKSESQASGDFMDYLNWRMEHDQREQSSAFASPGGEPDWGHKSTSDASREFLDFLEARKTAFSTSGMPPDRRREPESHASGRHWDSGVSIGKHLNAPSWSSEVSKAKKAGKTQTSSGRYGFEQPKKKKGAPLDDGKRRSSVAPDESPWQSKMKPILRGARTVEKEEDLDWARQWFEENAQPEQDTWLGGQQRQKGDAYSARNLKEPYAGTYWSQ